MASLQAKLSTFANWFQEVTIVASKTTYGQMLIYSYDRVQCKNVIPEVNYEEHTLSEIVAFIECNFDFKCVTFIDIGSNIGTQSVYMLKSNLAERVIAFEPDPNNFKLLRSNFIINDVDSRATAVNCALGDFDGIVNFELSPDNLGDHRVRLRDYDHWRQNEQSRLVIQVPLRTPQTALREFEIDYSTALVWLDAQGLEGHILTSFAKSDQKISYFVCEYWPYGIEIAGGRDLFFSSLELCEAIYNIKDLNPDKRLTMTDLRAYYDKALDSEANNVVNSIDLVCVVRRG